MMRALIVDDEAPARDKLRRWLTQEPDLTVVAEAADGLAAAQAIATLAPDIAFLDIQMPGLSGLEVAAQLEPATAPLMVFVTAFDEHAIKAFELNVADYLLKPYDRDRLRKTLDRLRARRLAPSTTAPVPDTVTVSSSAPTLRSALMVMVKSDGSSTPSRRTVPKPGSVKVTV